MGEFNHVKPFVWYSYGRRLRQLILNPRAWGKFTKEQKQKEEMRHVQGEEGGVESGNWVAIYLLIDTTDGQIADAKFQAFGQTGLIGAAEVICELVLRKNYDQAGRISADLIDAYVRDGKSGFPEETFGHINIALGALEEALAGCKDIELPKGYVATPVDLSNLGTGEYPDWSTFSLPEKLKLVSDVIETDIRPYVELDNGGVEVKSLEGDLTVVIGYEGTCTTCYSATGSTLNAIQQVLRAKVHPELVVKPDLGESPIQIG